MADLLITGRIATLDGDEGFGWTEAIAVKSGRVVAAGRPSDLASLAGAHTHRLELSPDDVALPGLTDAHLHLADAALAAGRVDLSSAGTPVDALEILANAERRLGDSRAAWLLGQGWNAASWGTWPLASDLDRVTGARPALLWSHDHHAVWVNSAALSEAGITSESTDPDGGLIRRLSDGSPAGTLHEEAVRLVADRVPPALSDELDAAIAAYGRELVELGIVAVHDPGPTGRDPRLEAGFASVGRLDAAGRLPVRVHASVRADSVGLAIERGLRSGAPLSRWRATRGRDQGGPRARMGWLKLFEDGAFGSRTAALDDPYGPDAVRGAPVGGERGMFVTEPDELRRLVSFAADGGIATQIHAIGDAAVHVALEAFAAVAPRPPGGVRPRIEHIQLLRENDAPRFARLGVAASVQPGHLIGDAPIARALLGSRADERGYPLATLARLGVLLPFGSDAPVESADPWPGIAIATTRRNASWGANVPAFGPGETLSLSRAIRSACLDGPVVAAERDRGRLAPGHLADVIVVPADALREPPIPDGPLASVRPRLVILGGEVVVER